MTDVVRPAATIILYREMAGLTEVLMGQRGTAAVFMPSKHVFPGGGVEPGDLGESETLMIGAECAARLARYCPPDAPGPAAIVAAGLRELAEETGLQLRHAGGAPPMRFVFRAITPPGRTRRFDARFFLADAKAVASSDDLSRASGELGQLQWIGVAAARALDLPFITEIVLAEVEAILRDESQPGVPFFDNSTDIPTFRRIA